MAFWPLDMMGKMTSLADAMQFNAGHDVNWSIVRNQYICSPSFQNLFGAKDKVDGLSAAVGIVEGGAVRQVPEVVTAVRTVGWTEKEGNESKRG